MRLIALLFAVLGLHLLQPSATHGQGITQEKLRTIVQKAIHDDPNFVNRPEFRIDPIALYFKFGAVNRPTVDTSDEAKPFYIPTDTQFQVELIRQYPWRLPNRKLWAKYLLRVETVIAKELFVIKSHKGSRKELMARLAELDTEVSELLFEAVQKMGQRERRQAVPVGAVPVRTRVVLPDGRAVDKIVWTIQTAFPRAYEVEVKSNPIGAKMFYLAQADYEVAQEEGLLNQDTAWYSISAGTYSMGGKFFFRARWPDNGRVAAPSKYAIRSKSVITLTPDSTDMADNPLAEFGEFVKQTGTLGKVYTFGAVVAPFAPPVVAAFAESPLWPERATQLAWVVTLVSGVLETLVYIACFQRLHKRSQATVERFLTWSFAISFILLFAFFASFYFFCYPVSGLGYTNDAQRYAARHPNEDVWDVLEAFANPGRSVFNEGYLAFMRLGILSLWLLLFIVLTLCFSAFVILQRKKQARRPRSGPEAA